MKTGGMVESKSTGWGKESFRKGRALINLLGRNLGRKKLPEALSGAKQTQASQLSKKQSKPGDSNLGGSNPGSRASEPGDFGGGQEHSPALWQLGAEWEGRGPIPAGFPLIAGHPLATSGLSFAASGSGAGPSHSDSAHSGGRGSGSEDFSKDSKAPPPGPDPDFEGQGARVLIVDDDVDWAEAVVLALEDEGIEALAVHSASEALRLLQGEIFHAAVIDVLMPDRWGVELVFELRQTVGDSLPIIVATGALSADGVAAGLLAGADDELFKVDARAELLPKLRRLWKRGRGGEQGAF